VVGNLADARQHGSADIGDPTGNAVERFLKWETDPERREIAKVAALPRALNQDVLTVITPAGKTAGLFGWLRGLPFVSQRGESWAYHDVVRAAMLRLRRAEAPIKWRSARYRTHPDHTSAAAGAAKTSSGDDRTVRPGQAAGDRSASAGPVVRAGTGPRRPGPTAGDVSTG
jgi:hypothetical protein